MKKVLRLTEGELKNVIRESAIRIVKEYIGDSEEFGRYDIDDEHGSGADLSDDEYDDLLNQIAIDNEQEDEDMKGVFDDMEAEQWIGQEYYDPSDNDLYRGMY